MANHLKGGGRKVMGLKLWQHSQDCQTAEESSSVFVISQVWRKLDLFICTLISNGFV
jgi:hypothetical protein